MRKFFFKSAEDEKSVNQTSVQQKWNSSSALYSLIFFSTRHNLTLGLAV